MLGSFCTHKFFCAVTKAESLLRCFWKHSVDWVVIVTQHDALTPKFFTSLHTVHPTFPLIAYIQLFFRLVPQIIVHSILMDK